MYCHVTAHGPGGTGTSRGGPTLHKQSALPALLFPLPGNR